jgi:hypothetical protein
VTHLGELVMHLEEQEAHLDLEMDMYHGRFGEMSKISLL